MEKKFLEMNLKKRYEVFLIKSEALYAVFLL